MMEAILSALYWLFAGVMLFTGVQLASEEVREVTYETKVHAVLGIIHFAIVLAMVANGPSRFVQAVLR